MIYQAAFEAPKPAMREILVKLHHDGSVPDRDEQRHESALLRINARGRSTGTDYAGRPEKLRDYLIRQQDSGISSGCTRSACISRPR